MLKRVIALPVAVLTLTWASPGKTDVSADVAKPLISALEDSDICQMPPTPEQREESQAAIAAYQTRRGTSTSAAAGDNAQEDMGQGAPKGWPGKGTIGGNIPPTAAVMDPWPTYDGIAVDGENGVVAMSDENRHGILIYDAASGGTS